VRDATPRQCFATTLTLSAAVHRGPKRRATARARAFPPGAAGECLQPQYSLIVRDIEHEVLPVSRQEGLGVIPWSPLAGGFLSGKYSREDAPPENTRMASWSDTWERHATPEKFDIVDRVSEIAKSHGKEPAQVALSWLKDRPGVTSPIFGARNIEQLDKNLETTGWSLEERELNSLDEVSALPYAYPYDMISRVNA
jgi:aryl-alcohol dehydrogenase-like predicted oxidoreductase